MEVQATKSSVKNSLVIQLSASPLQPLLPTTIQHDLPAF
jgi:hypothetical protein